MTDTETTQASTIILRRKDVEIFAEHDEVHVRVEHLPEPYCHADELAGGPAVYPRGVSAYR